MDVSNNLDGLRSLLGISGVAATGTGQVKNGAAARESSLESDCATFSTAGNQASSTVSDGDVRSDKVVQIQSALAAGSYAVPAALVASRVVDAMLSGKH